VPAILLPATVPVHLTLDGVTGTPPAETRTLADTGDPALGLVGERLTRVAETAEPPVGCEIATAALVELLAGFGSDVDEPMIVALIV
jgi:hypothetical protein